MRTVHAQSLFGDAGRRRPKVQFLYCHNMKIHLGDTMNILAQLLFKPLAGFLTTIEFCSNFKPTNSHVDEDTSYCLRSLI
ncbi:hypothetical protein K1719_030259 [Acacia pycnantha]|nr:hypothetical protein K1719_030259 [Acacia pycnantha]